MADHIGSAFGALAGAPLPGGGADMPLSPQWRQPFGRTTSVEQPMKSALIGPWDGNSSGAPASKPDAAAKQAGTAWRGPDGPPSRDPKWPEKDRPDYNAARDRPAPTSRWREREEDSRDRGNTWETDRWGSVEEPRRWQDDRGSGGRGRGRPPADDRWVDRKPSGTPLGEREWLPGMPPEPELPKRPSLQDRWGSDSADRRSAEDRWRTPGAAGAPLTGGPGGVEPVFSSSQAGRGRGFATGRGRGLKPSGPSAPGSGVPDRWDAPRGSLDRQDSISASGGNGAGYGGGSQGGSVRRYSSPQMNKIYHHLLSSHGEKLPMPRINPEVAVQYPEYLAGMAAEAAAMSAQQLGGGGSNGGTNDSAGGASGAPAGALNTSATPLQSAAAPPAALNPPVTLPITHEVYLQDQWLYKDPQGVTQGPFTRSDILDWMAFQYFGEDLPVRAASLESAPFIPLGQMMKMWDAIERGRPIGPPGFAPVVPQAVIPVPAANPAQQQTQQPPAAAPALGSVSSMSLSTAPSGDLQQQPQQAITPAQAAATTGGAPGAASAQRTSSLLETLLGRKLASEPAMPAAAGGLSAGPQMPVAPPAPLSEPAPQPGGARPFTLDPPVQLPGAGGLGAGTLTGLGGLGGPLGGGLGGFASGLPGGGGMGPSGIGGMGPGGMGPGPWGGPLVAPGGPLPGGPGGPMLPGWGRDPLAGGFDPLRRPDLHPGMHAGIWGNAGPFRPEGPPLGPGAFIPAPVPGNAPHPQQGLAPLSDPLASKASGPLPPAPAPASAPGPVPASAQTQTQVAPPAPQQQQQLAAPAPPPSAWGVSPAQPVAHTRSLADIQREQAMEAARQAAMREQQALAEASASAPGIGLQQPVPAPAPAAVAPAAQEAKPQSPQHPPPGAWGAPQPDPYRPTSGLPPALQQIFAAASKPPSRTSLDAGAVSVGSVAEPAADQAAVVLAAGQSGSKKEKSPETAHQAQQLGLQVQQFFQAHNPKQQSAPQAADSQAAPPTVTATATEEVAPADPAGAPSAVAPAAAATAQPRPEPKLAPWAAAAAAKPPAAGMTLREIQMQEAEAAARAARAAATAQEMAAAAASQAAAAAAPTTTVAASAPTGASPWAKIAAAAPSPNAAVVSAPLLSAPPPATTAWRPAAAPAAAPTAPATASVAADTSPNRKIAPASSNAAAAPVAPAARGGRPASGNASTAPEPPVGVTGTAPRGTTLAELLEKQLNPAPPAAQQGSAAKAWGGAAAKPPPITNLRAVLYEESAADLEGGAVDEDLSDVLPMLQQKQPPLQPPAAVNGSGWAAVPAPPPGPTLRDIQLQEEEARRRAAAAAAPPARAASGSTAAVAAAPSDDEGLFWEYGSANTTNIAAANVTAHAASIEAPKPGPAPAKVVLAPAPAAPTPRGGWASAVGAATTAPTAAAVAAKGSAAAAAPAARTAAAVAAKSAAAVASAPSRPAAPAPAAAPAASTSYASAPTSAGNVGDDSAGLFDGEVQMSAEFRNWCRSKMIEFFGNDDLSLVHFLMTVNSRSEVADYCQMYMRGKPNVSTFVAEFLKRKDQERQSSAKSKGKSGGASGSGSAAGTAKGSAKGAAVVSEWQKATSGGAQSSAGSVGGGTNKKSTAAGGKQQAVKKVGGITATVPGFSLLSDRA